MSFLGFDAVGRFSVGEQPRNTNAYLLANGATVSVLGGWADTQNDFSYAIPSVNLIQRTAEDYAQGWANLLPTGPAWPRDPDSVLQTVVLGLAGIWGDPVDANAAKFLVTEAYPGSADLMLPDWERNFGLPDPCIPTEETDITGRQNNLIAKMTFLGRQDRNFFVIQAANVGNEIAIREYSPYQCGISGVGDTTNIDPDGLGSYRWGLGPEEIRFYWDAKVTALAPSWNGANLYCLMNRWKPAHTIVTVDYSALQDLKASRPWNSGYYALL